MTYDFFVSPNIGQWIHSAKDTPKAGEVYQPVDNPNLSHPFSSDWGYTAQPIIQQWNQGANTQLKSQCDLPTLSSSSGIVRMLKNVESLSMVTKLLQHDC